MHPVLRSILSDRILLTLLLGLAVQSYRVADNYGNQPAPASTYKEFIDQISRGEPIRIPLADGTSTILTVPTSEDGTPIDVRPLFTEGGPFLEKKLAEAEQKYGPTDLRTIKARVAYAGVLLYRGEQQRAANLIRQNYDILMAAEDMAADQRLEQWLTSAKLLEPSDNSDYQDLLAPLLRLGRANVERAPEQAVEILNEIGKTHLESSEFSEAAAYYREAQRVRLDPRDHASTMIATGLGLTGALIRSGDKEAAREEARKVLKVVSSLDKQSSSERQISLQILEKVYERLGDAEYVALTKSMR